MQQHHNRDNDTSKMAYAIWESEGYPEGKNEEHWVRAQKIIEGDSPDEIPTPQRINEIPDDDHPDILEPDGAPEIVPDPDIKGIPTPIGREKKLKLRSVR